MWVRLISQSSQVCDFSPSPQRKLTAFDNHLINEFPGYDTKQSDG